MRKTIIITNSFFYSRKTENYWKKEPFFHDKKKLPLISFGNGMFNKNQVIIKNHRTGVTDVFYRQLRRRQKNGDLLLTYVDEFRTSKVIRKNL